MSDNRENMNQLVDQCVNLAVTLLRKNGEFYPFAFYLDRNGEVIVDMGEAESEHPDPNQLIDHLLEEIRKSYKNGVITTATLTINTKITDPETGHKRDAIAVRIDDIKEVPIILFYPYSRNLFKKVTIFEPIANKEEKGIFDK